MVGTDIGEDWTLCMSDPEVKKEVFFCELLPRVGRKCETDPETQVQKEVVKVIIIEIDIKYNLTIDNYASSSLRLWKGMEL